MLVKRHAYKRNGKVNPRLARSSVVFTIYFIVC